MSLVNDLLIEAERRRSGARPMPAQRLEELVPTRNPRAASGPAIGFGAAVVVLALFGLIAGGLHLGGALRGADLAAVAAKRASTHGAVDSQNVPTQTTALRPVRIETVELERVPALTRLRIRTDARTPHRFDHDAARGRLDLVLESASLVEPSAPFALLDTPIRALDLRAEGSDVFFTLTLDPDVRSQVRWLELTDGAVLLVELQAPPSVAAAGAGPEHEYVDGKGNAEVDVVVEAPLPPAEGAPLVDGTDAADAVDGADAAVRSSASSESTPVPASPAPLDEIAASRADRLIAPALGDPAALRIERSQRDRARASEAERAISLADTIASARRARAEGRLDDADLRYAEAVLLAPRQESVIVEWSELLFEQDRAEEALELVARARAEAPRNVPLLIAHARLLERQGALGRAIDLLEGSALAVTEAPDVHALAAAYHQRAGDHAAAVERYEAVLRRFPSEARNWMGLGISLEAEGRPSEARDVYRIALQVGELPGGTRRWVMDRLTALGRED